MPTIPHESLIAELLRDAFGLELPPHTDARIAESDFTQLVPAAYRADLGVKLLRDGAAVMGFVIEVQLRAMGPLYGAAFHAELRCPIVLVVIAPDDAVARWAEEPITTLQLGSPFVPVVINRARIPVVTSAAEAARAPELAVLSALAHGRGSHEVAVARAAIGATASLDDEKRTLYNDLVMSALSAAARGILELEMDLRNYEFKSEFFKERIARAKAEGADEARVEAEAHGQAVGEARQGVRAILAVLSARGIDMTDAVRATITGTTDVARLERWVRRAVTAATAEEVVGEES